MDARVHCAVLKQRTNPPAPAAPTRNKQPSSPRRYTTHQ
jgi:hypothetical protein